MNRVLVVEDNMLCFKLFSKLIIEKTADLFEFVHVTSMEEALLSLKNNNYIFILLDLHLPDSTDPLNTIRVMIAATKYTPIIVTTKSDDLALLNLAYANGVEDYLVKDNYDLATFLHVVKSAVKRFASKLRAEVLKHMETLGDEIKVMQKTYITVE